MLQQCAPEGSWGQKRGSTYRCPVPRGRGQADLRRGESGRVRNTGQSPLFADGEPSISNDRALKVTVLTPLKEALFRQSYPTLFLMNLIKSLRSVGYALSVMRMTVSYSSEADGREIE